MLAVLNARNMVEILVFRLDATNVVDFSEVLIFRLGATNVVEMR